MIHRVTVMMILFLLLPIRMLQADEPMVAKDFVLERYAGTWHEIARKPNFFQRSCQKETTATYTLNPSGNVDVLNRCVRLDGSLSEVKGKAWAPDKTQPAKMKVQFFWPFSGPYWVHMTDPDYTWAIVGDNKRKNLWFMSRTPKLSAATFETLRQNAITLGYDLSDLITPP